MNYEFPRLQHIDDVLPAIAGRDEFIVAEREGYTVINYMVVTPDTFRMSGPEDIMGAIRREARGLIFNKSGALISRPFHKFFNIGERDETQPHALDFNRPHVVMNKEDGSMIRPIPFDGGFRLGTKMGITDVALQAEAFLVGHPNYPRMKAFIENMIRHGWTPIFEYVGPNNKIVLDYDREDLILLALRNNLTGEYLPNRLMKAYGLFAQPERYAGVDKRGYDGYAASVAGDENREGDIVMFDDGHMVKIKSDWYLRLHKLKDLISSDHKVIGLIVNEELDDILPKLDKTDLDRVTGLEQEFWARFDKKHTYLKEKYMLDALLKYDGDRKRIALEMVPTLPRKEDARFIFGALDGRGIRESMLQHVKNNLSTGTRYDVLKEWLKGD